MRLEVAKLRDDELLCRFVDRFDPQGDGTSIRVNRSGTFRGRSNFSVPQSCSACCKVISDVALFCVLR